MKRALICMLCLVSCKTQTDATGAQAGVSARSERREAWRYAQWGMTKDELRAASIRNKEIISDCNEPKWQGLVLRRYDVDGHTFDVKFSFDNGALSSVTLIGMDNGPAGGEQRYNAMLLLLTEKYGRPVAETRGARMWKAKWKAQHADIELSMEPAYRMTVIDYMPPAGATDKL